MALTDLFGLLGGLALFLYGMQMMSNGLEKVAGDRMEGILQKLTANRFLGVAVGAIFTAVIQSSSASVGILQTLAASGLLPFSSAVFVLFGMNIGTCITSVLASIGTNRSAKRTTIIHLMFNLIGTVIFTILCLILPIADWVGALTPGKPAAQIANMHTIFNIATTCLLIPFGTLMAKAATKILPDISEDKDKTSILGTLNKEFGRTRTQLGADAMRIDILRQEIGKMLVLSGENVERCFNAVLKNDGNLLKEAQETETIIDTLNKDISQYISKILVNSNSDANVTSIEQYFLITGNAERIGDHAMNIGEYLDTMKRKHIVFSDGAKSEIAEMRDITKKAIDKVLEKDDDVARWLSEIAAMEQQMDDMTRNNREHHLERLRKGHCTEEACVLYSEILTDFERIGDHVLNIAQAISKME